MSSKLITEAPESQSAPNGWRIARETAPSFLREDEPQVARWIGLVGLMLVTLGSMAVFASAANIASRINPALGGLFLIVGVACLLFHAARDAEPQVRWLYRIIGYMWLAVGVVVTLLPFKGQPGTLFLPYGYVCLVLALLFLLPVTRNETEMKWRQLTLRLLGATGAILALVGFIGGNFSENFLIPYSQLLVLLGLAYVAAFIGMEGSSSNTGYWTSLALGALGLVVFLAALVRSVLPFLFRHSFEPYLVPSGLLLMTMGLLYAGLAMALFSDNHLAVLTRRELAAFFYSPIAYIVLFGLTVIGWLIFFDFVNRLFPPPGPMEQRMFREEPIILGYGISWWPVISTIFIVPVLTMRLLSEEHRTGTLEVLFTAPVKETSVVLSKFFATLIFFMLAWVPWALFLVALRVEGGQPFEYRPLLGFFIALACSGAGFVSLGLFFSSLTRNQIASAILTFVGMLALTGVFFAKGIIDQFYPGSNWSAVLDHASYVNLWITSMEGQLAPQHLIFFISFAIFWLFVTVKILESRKWR
jgi:ABC-type transport system involved in multi-copper enzyme maturation permease subunit